MSRRGGGDTRQNARVFSATCGRVKLVSNIACMHISSSVEKGPGRLKGEGGGGIHVYALYIATGPFSSSGPSSL